MYEEVFANKRYLTAAKKWSLYSVAYRKWMDCAIYELSSAVGEIGYRAKNTVVELSIDSEIQYSIRT